MAFQRLTNEARDGDPRAGAGEAGAGAPHHPAVLAVVRVLRRAGGVPAPATRADGADAGRVRGVARPRDELEQALGVIQPRWVVSTTPPCMAIDLIELRQEALLPVSVEP